MKPSIRACSFALGLTLSHVGCHPWTSEPSQTRDPQREGLAVRVVASGLADPFEVAWGPDGALWVTERTGRRVTRVAVATGEKTTLFAADEAVATPGAQDGLLGMALDPRLLDGSGHDFVYISYTYDADPSPDALDRRAKIVRLTYDAATGQLGAPLDLVSGMPASTTAQLREARVRPGREALLHHR
jgi:glucose/arabinose dehydrogenase